MKAIHFLLNTFYLFTLVAAVAWPAQAAKKKNRSINQTPSPNHVSSINQETLQKILTIEDQRLESPFLVSQVSSTSPTIAKRALLALGRIGDPAVLEPIVRVMQKKDNALKLSAAFTLGLIQDPTALKMLVQNIPLQKDPMVISALLRSLGRAGNEQSLNTISDALNAHKDIRVLEAGCHAAGMLWSGGSEKWAVPEGLLLKLTKLALEPGHLGLKAAFALARFKGDPSQIPLEEMIKAAQKTPSPEARALLCRPLGKLKTPASTKFLSQSVILETHLGTRLEAIKALGNHPVSEEVLSAYRKALTDTRPVIVFQTLESLGVQGTAVMSQLTDKVDRIVKNHVSAWVRSAALKNLCRINPIVGRQRVQDVFKVTDSPLLAAAIASLGILGESQDIEKLSSYLTHPEVRMVTEALEATSTLAEEKYTPELRAGIKRALERVDTATSALAAQLAEKYKWKDFAPSLASVYPLFTAPDQVEVKVALLGALGAVGDLTHLPTVEAALKETEKQVIVAAVKAYEAITKMESPVKVPLNSKVVATPPSYPEAMAALKAKVVLVTSKGEVHLAMEEDAPVTALNFIRLVKKGALKQTFYDGKNFHRVVPNFVVQGGDPRGDGYGGPGYLIRDEVSDRLHLRGTVGMATAGKDTGGCQFFINLAPNLHLDGRYTLFAKVTKGMDVADKLEVGDRIITARIE